MQGCSAQGDEPEHKKKDDHRTEVVCAIDHALVAPIQEGTRVLVHRFVQASAAHTLLLKNTFKGGVGLCSLVVLLQASTHHVGNK